jgi:hypothetical protein
MGDDNAKDSDEITTEKEIKNNKAQQKRTKAAQVNDGPAQVASNLMPAETFPNVPLPPRVVTPRTLRQSPPRVPAGSQRLSPRNLSQDDFCGMDSAHMAISLGHNHWSQQHQPNAVIHPVTGKEMEYSALMKYPRLQPLWT